MPEGKPSFWTTFPGILTGLATLVGVIVASLSLAVRDHHPNRKSEPQEKIFLARLDAHEHEFLPTTCPSNSWYAYVIDFSGLSEITRDYVRYIQENQNADKNDVVLQKLQTSLEVFRIRNQAGTKDYDRTNLHSQAFPRKFRMILDAIESRKRTGLSVDDERGFEVEIQNWSVEAGFPPHDKIAAITSWCLFN